MAADELRQRHPKEAIEYLGLVQRRTTLTPITLAPYVSALGAARQCANAAARTASAQGLLPEDCRMTVDGQPIECARYVQQAYEQLQPACPG